MKNCLKLSACQPNQVDIDLSQEILTRCFFWWLRSKGRSQIRRILRWAVGLRPEELAMLVRFLTSLHLKSWNFPSVHAMFWLKLSQIPRFANILIPHVHPQKCPKKKPRKTVNQEVSQKHPLSPSVPFQPYIFMPASRTWEAHSDSGHRLLAPRDANGSEALAPLAPVLWRLVLLLPCLWWNFEIHILGRIS